MYCFIYLFCSIVWSLRTRLWVVSLHAERPGTNSVWCSSLSVLSHSSVFKYLLSAKNSRIYMSSPHFSLELWFFYLWFGFCTCTSSHYFKLNMSKTKFLMLSQNLFPTCLQHLPQGTQLMATFYPGAQAKNMKSFSGLLTHPCTQLPIDQQILLDLATTSDHTHCSRCSPSHHLFCFLGHYICLLTGSLLTIIQWLPFWLSIKAKAHTVNHKIHHLSESSSILARRLPWRSSNIPVFLPPDPCPAFPLA